MGAPITEIVVEQLIKTGLEQLRNQPYKIDMILSGLNQGIFAPLYGQKVIDQVKTYILNRKIAVVQSLQLVPDQAPCYSILMVGSVEDSARSHFDDFDYRVDKPVQPNKLATFVTLAYDSITGFVSVSDAVDLGPVYIGAIVTDATNEPYEVIGPIIEVTGQKGFYIVPGASFAIGQAIITSQINIQSQGDRSIPILDSIQIGVHARDDINMTKYLYYLIVYWFSSRRIELENIGYQIHRYKASDMIREQDLLPDNITSRYMTFDFWTHFSWTDDPWISLADLNNKILVKQYLWKKDDDTAVGTIIEN